MKNTPLRPTLPASNTATRLRELLGIPAHGRPRKARPAVREQMVIEAIEPRVLLSAERNRWSDHGPLATTMPLLRMVQTIGICWPGKPVAGPFTLVTTRSG